MKFRIDLRLVKAAVCLLAVLACFLGGMFFIRIWERDHDRVRQAAAGGETEDEKGQELTSYKNAWYAPRRNLETVLVLGIDKYTEDQENPGNGSFEQADFLMLLVLDEKAGICTAVHINRDTMTEIQVLSDSGAVLATRTGQITLAHTYGGSPELMCRNTMEAVSTLLYGVPIDHYISLTMDSVPVLNDLAGGVTLEVLDDFGGIDETLIKGRTATLKGRQALTYVRARQGLEDSSNLHRMKRQRQYLEALQTKLFEKIEEEEGFLLSSLLEINPYMVSDCSVEQLSDLVRAIQECGERDYLALEGEAKQGDTYMEFYVDEDALQEMVMERFYEKAEEG